MAEVTTWVVSDLTKEDRTKLITLVEGWKKSTSLCMPRIGDIVVKGRKVEIHFGVGNSRNVKTLLATNGFPIISTI